MNDPLNSDACSYPGFQFPDLYPENACPDILYLVTRIETEGLVDNSYAVQRDMASWFNMISELAGYSEGIMLTVSV